MKIRDLLGEELIKLNLEADSKRDVLKELVDLLAEAGKITAQEEFYQVILAREKTSTTGVGKGVAIPHGKSKVVTEPALVFGKKEAGVEFNSLDSKPAKIFFMIAVPEENSGEHLDILSKLSRKLMHDDFREALLNVESKEEVFNIIKDYE